jgi:putative endonuclease
MSGYSSYRKGLAAEDTVADHYAAGGYQVVARRWRSDAGEIDLILRKNDNVIFVEVKAARTLANAAHALSPRQAQRIYSSAEIFLDGEPLGLATPSRIDVALVAANGTLEVLENVVSA